MKAANIANITINFLSKNSDGNLAPSSTTIESVACQRHQYKTKIGANMIQCWTLKYTFEKNRSNNIMRGGMMLLT